MPRLAGADQPASVLVDSLERGGAFRRAVLSAGQLMDPALGLGSAGVRLVLLARSGDQLAETAGELTAAGAAGPLIV
jgi:hypothetical protein